MVQNFGWSVRVSVAVVVPLLVSGSTFAQPAYDVVAGFNVSVGNRTTTLIEAPDGNVYGTTSDGPSFEQKEHLGTIFKVDAAGTMTVVHRFSGAHGGHPSGLILTTDGTFYGATAGGGTHQVGTIFRIDTRGTVTTLHNFEDFTDSDGAYPVGLIQATDGAFYGTTYGGGATGKGAVFRIDTAGTFTLIHAFTGTDGAAPAAALIQASDRSLYGTTSAGGPTDDGTVFRIDPSGAFKTIHTFRGTDGSAPLGLVQGRDGMIYGVTYRGGETGEGTVFKLDRSDRLTTIHTFMMAADDTAGPLGLLRGSDGNFYGTTTGPGGIEDEGSIIKIDSQGNVTTIHRLSDEGAHFDAGLIQHSDGHLYGTTNSGGPNGLGAVFRLVMPGRTLSPVADTYVRAGAYASRNFGDKPTLLAKKGLAPDNTRRSYLAFDVASVGTFQRATLRLFGRVSNGSTPAITTTVYAVSETAWDERTVTWNTRPALGRVLGRLTIDGGAAGWLDLDITKFVASERAAGHDVIAVALRSVVHSSASASFNSREARSGQPRLVIEP